MHPTDRSDGGSSFEAAAVGVLGAGVAALVGRPIGLAGPFAVVGALNGAITGWRQVYEWRRPAGSIAFVLDSTWSLPMTSAALVSQVLGRVRGAAGYDAALSRRQNRQVFRRGFVPRRGFAITIGNVISGAGDTSQERRRRLVSDHEDVHVWQGRWLGPVYPLLYGAWMIVGGAAGVGVWAASRRTDPVTRVVETCAYYCNPFEWWAYSRHGQWPPGGKVADIGWRRPIARPRQRR